MHAIIVRSTIHDYEQGREFLRSQVVPRVSQAPGLVAAYWVRAEETGGRAMIVLESEEAARGVAEQIRSNPPPSGVVSIDSVEIGEVVEHAGVAVGAR